MPIGQQNVAQRPAWNTGRLIGPKPPLKPRHIRAIRTRLQHEHRVRDLAMVNLAIDSKLRGCDRVDLRIGDVVIGGPVRLRTSIIRQPQEEPPQARQDVQLGRFRDAIPCVFVPAEGQMLFASRHVPLPEGS